MRAILAALSFLLATCAPAAAQDIQCAPREPLGAKLATQYDEHARAIGLTSNGMLMELFASLEDGSWTMLLTRPNGMACIIASGTDFGAVKVILGDPT